MKKHIRIRFSLSLLFFVSLLSPTLALAADGKKHFKLGMDAEVAEQWDKAVEEFALAVADNPKSPEFRLHYQRALFNASQMYMKRGTALANEKDFAGAYLAFRKAYGYDPVNELAKSEMERMLRLQQAVLQGENPDKVDTDANGVKLTQAGYQKVSQQDTVVPQRLEKLQDVPFPGGVDLQFLIKELAKQLDLNVLFDSQTFRPGTERKIKIELKNVTAAKALDYIFLQESLFFQKVGPRTILVAEQNRRQNYQQLVLRTFYLANAAPEDVQKVVQTAIPAQPGRTPTITLVDKATNSITVRDTEENIRLIGKLINSLDKDRAEVVMDVAIYEISKTDLLQFGTQIGNTASLTNLGGSNSGIIGLAGNGGVAAGASYISRSLGLGLVVPQVNFQALQDKKNTNLIASTQIHAFNNEDSSARIGQRVPVRSATISNGFNTAGSVTPTGTVSNGFVGDVINYEQVGLTLKFKPIVFPNQDVQVAMEIESKDVAGASTLTPTFTERTIKGTARVQNNKTLMLASVAQGVQSNGRTGLPLLGLIPVLGRLFTAPTKDNRQVDIVIAITPRVIRAPAILPEDEIERPTGSLGIPTTGSLEAMIIRDEQEEQLAAARRIPSQTQVQLPDQKVSDAAPAYTKDVSTTAAPTTDAAQNQNVALNQQTTASAPAIANNLRPIDASARTLQIEQTADTSMNKAAEANEQTGEPSSENAKASAPTAELQLIQSSAAMKAGERTKIAVMVKSAAAFRSAVLGIKFDDKKLAVRSVSYGEVFGGASAQTDAKPFLNQGGKMFVSLSSSKDTSENSSGILAYIEVEALADGAPVITLDRDVLNFLTADGKNFSIVNK